jgi:hypothetical protein
VTVNLFKGIGYLILGNLYDNVKVPKTLTFYLLLVLSVLTALCALVPEDIARNITPERDEKWDQLVTQMSSIRLFESGVEMACLIILFNWFPLKASAFIVALWQTSYLIIPLVLEGFNVSGTENYVRIGYLRFL